MEHRARPNRRGHGFTQHTSRTITIHDELHPAQAAATMLHEVAHALMHADATDYHQHRGIFETEAESVAYIVAGVLGLDTASKSIGYIAGWTEGDVETVKTTASRVLATARTILDGITEDSPTERHAERHINAGITHSAAGKRREHIDACAHGPGVVPAHHAVDEERAGGQHPRHCVAVTLDEHGAERADRRHRGKGLLLHPGRIGGGGEVADDDLSHRSLPCSGPGG